MPLIELSLPQPDKLRNGWAALAAVYAARGWGTDVYATPDEWLYHDGGGNWVCLRFKSNNQAVLIGHDHEYSEAYFGEAAKYFEEDETDLLAGTPDWWSFNLSPLPFGEWIGFVYGWDGTKWRRAEYYIPDGFDKIGLLKACSLDGTDLLKEIASDAPDLNGELPTQDALNTLVSVGPYITFEQLDMVVPGWDIDAGLAAARKFK